MHIFRVPLIFASLCFIITTSFGFGKNKVQYTKFHWKFLENSHFRIYYHDGQNDLPKIAYRWTNNAFTSLQTRFRYTPRDYIPIVIYGSTNFFAQTNVITEVLPEGVGGFTEFFKNRVVIPFNGSYKEFRHVLHHELVHAFTLAMIQDQPGGNLLMSSSVHLPLWFMEGTAEYLSSGWDIEADMFLIDQTVFSSVPLPGPALNGYLAYKGGQSFLYFLVDTKGDSTFSSFLNEFRKTKNVELAFKTTYDQTLEEIGEIWIRELKRIYWPEIGRRIDPSFNAQSITSHQKTGDRFNLRPRISPDGTKIAFFSDRRDYTRILITNRKGEILHEISQSGAGGYFESFHPFRSGICWSPDSKRLAFITKRQGKDELRIVHIDNKRLVKKIPLPLWGASSPDWSPDSKKIVISGMQRGYGDLFLYDFESDTIHRLTHTLSFESDPHFSPDGKRIVFTVEDTSGRADSLFRTYGATPTDIMSLELSTGLVTARTSTPWNEKQPCFSPDGRHLLYVSDRNGIDNLYIGPIDTLANARPITNYVGGCSHPDWSSDSTVVFTLFQKQGWDIWQIDKPFTKFIGDTLAHTQWVQSMLDTSHPFFITPPSHHSDTNIATADTAVSSTKESAYGDIVEYDIHSDSLTHPMDSPVAPKTTMMTRIITDSGDTILSPDSTIDDFFVKFHLRDYYLSLLQDSGVVDTVTTEFIVLTTTDSGSVHSDSPQPPLRLIATALPFDTIARLDTTDSIEGIGDTSTTLPDSPATIAQANDSTTRTESEPVTIPQAQPYRLQFSPDIATVGLGINSYYGNTGQWLLTFSDVLGDHRLTFMGDIQGSFDDYLHLFGSYDYLKQRLDIGTGIFYNKDYTSASIYGDSLFHDSEFGGFIRMQYPFSLISRLNAAIISRTIHRKPIGHDGPSGDENVLLSYASYVFDNSLWGITGPLNGTRASLMATLSPPFAFVNTSFISLDFDARNYTHFLKRFVWANRLYLGYSAAIGGSTNSARRYFLGGNEYWLFPVPDFEEYKKNIPFTFYSDFVTPFRGWPYIAFTGTNIAVLNSEFRFPFIRSIDIVWPLPVSIRYINGALFADVGNAWDRSEQMPSFPIPRALYGGIGFGFRMNAGIFVIRFDRGWPTDWASIAGPPINYFSLGAEF